MELKSPGADHHILGAERAPTEERLQRSKHAKPARKEDDVIACQDPQSCRPHTATCLARPEQNSILIEFTLRDRPPCERIRRVVLEDNELSLACEERGCFGNYTVPFSGRYVMKDIGHHDYVVIPARRIGLAVNMPCASSAWSTRSRISCEGSQPSIRACAK